MLLTKILYFCEKVITEMIGINTEVWELIRSWGRGKIFFPQDFAQLESPDCVRQALCVLTNERQIIRLAHGVYCYPRIVGEYKMQTVYPSEESIAEAIAAKENVRIIPYGDQAGYKLGLTTFRVSDLKYLTDGAPRKINLAKGRKIYFNHTSEVKMFAFCNENMQMLSSAIRALGKEYLDDPVKKRTMHDILRKVPEAEFAKDIVLPPAWVGEIILDVWNN